MRVALFGGSFDPPHRGHLALARLARERLALDRVLVAPVGAQPLKRNPAPAGFDDRLTMSRLAFIGEEGMEVSLLDSPRLDGRSNYTIDTLTEMRRQLSPGDALFCILGADSFLTIRKWYRPAELITTCDFIIGARPGFNLGQAHAALPGGVSATQVESALPDTCVLEVHGSNRHHSLLYLLMDLAEDVSATQIRSAMRGESGAAAVLNPAVAEYIRIHRLYEHL